MHRPVLGAVQETALIPLYLRARESQRPDAICRDQKAVEIVASLDYDFLRFDDADSVQLDVAVRTEILDEATTAFLERDPESIVVNLGAGLDGRFLRLDNGRVRWFDMDLPDVIQLRRQFYNESPRNRFLAQDAFDLSWIETIGRQPGQAVLAIAEGLFPYVQETRVRHLLCGMAEQLAGAELLCQTISPQYVDQQHRIPAVNKTQAKFQWGIKSGLELTAWDPRIEVLAEWALVDRHRRRWHEVIRRW